MMWRTILLSTLDHSKVPLELVEIAAVKIHCYKLCADTFGIVTLCKQIRFLCLYSSLLSKGPKEGANRVPRRL